MKISESIGIYEFNIIISTYVLLYDKKVINHIDEHIKDINIKSILIKFLYNEYYLFIEKIEENKIINLYNIELYEKYFDFFNKKTSINNLKYLLEKYNYELLYELIRLSTLYFDKNYLDFLIFMHDKLLEKVNKNKISENQYLKKSKIFKNVMNILNFINNNIDNNFDINCTYYNIKNNDTYNDEYSNIFKFMLE